MKRALSVTCASVVLALGGIAAAGKPTIAVLGVEVVGSDVTAADTGVAKDLTDGLRSRAKAGTGPYQLAAGADKELIDEKLLKGCDDEKPACMATIGTDLNADYVLYGKIEKQGSAYRVDLKLLNVGRKAIEKTWPDNIPVSESTGAKIQGWAKKGYAKLTGQGSSGTLIVKVSNVDRATVKINGVEKGSVVSGRAEITGLSPGKYKVTISPDRDGFKPTEREVSIDDDSPTDLSVELEKIDAPPPPPLLCDPAKSECGRVVSGGGSNKGMWTGVFYTGLGVAAIGGGVWIYGWRKIASAEDDLCSFGGYHPSTGGANDLDHTDTIPGGGDCRVKHTKPTGDLAAANKAGDQGRNLSRYGAIATAAGGIVAIVALWRGYLRSDDSERLANGKRVKRERFVVTPVISPEGGGMTVRFDW